jgi:hypothetical protein
MQRLLVCGVRSFRPAGHQHGGAALYNAIILHWRTCPFFVQGHGAAGRGGICAAPQAAMKLVFETPKNLLGLLCARVADGRTKIVQYRPRLRARTIRPAEGRRTETSVFAGGGGGGTSCGCGCYVGTS